MKPTADFKDRLLACLGGPWPEPPPLQAKELSSEQVESVRRIKISYQTEPGEIVSAWLLVPDSATKDKPAPGICLWHQHNGAWHFGASEPAGLAGLPMHHTGLALAKEGYVVVCPDALGFGEREKGYKNKGGALERFLFLKYVVDGKCLAWKHILDMRRAVDLIASRPEVDANKLGCYGHSMGSTHTWLVGPWEPRLKALVGNCCLPTYAGIHRTQILHCFPNFIPGLNQFGDTPDIAALIAPRALHLNLGDQDGGTPIEEAREGIGRIEKAYQAAHAEKNFSSFIEPNTGHVLSPAMWEKVKAFFAQHLG
ncbi:dienelactone hydrolase family protein [Anatilimnocola floriformis]|uniref:dienelactone hydrolase family protein n=1 Tax=Anatilimnocola floriformis TaxID=2948575 RepID=UPI0020C4D50D|nr:acetylxylan esterase [Anatilimnocola floriformis]